MQPRLREVPVPDDGKRRDVQNAGGLFNAQAAEEAQFDDFALPGVQLREPVQGFVEREQIRSAVRRANNVFFQRYRPDAASPLLIATRAGMVDKNAAHDLRSDAIKVRPIFPPRVFPIRQAQVSLVDQGSCLECVLGILASHGPAGQPAQLCINQRRHLFRRGWVAFAPGAQQDGYVFPRQLSSP